MSITSYEKDCFFKAYDKVINKNSLNGGIGTLSEKTMHAIIKNYYESDESYQEIRVGTNIADIYKDGEIIEIQTRSFDKLRKKLDAFLPEHPVTIVHPIVHKKKLIWIDPNTGELSEPRKSPKTGSVLDAFREIYKIKMYLNDPNLTINITMVDATEYRILNKNPKYAKYHTTRYDRIPTELIDEYCLNSFSDYVALLPKSLPECFTVQQLAKEGHVTRSTAGIVANIMREVGAIEHVDTIKRAYVYRIKP